MLRILTCILFLCPLVQADVSVRERAVDVVLLDDGHRLMGVVLSNAQTTKDRNQPITMMLRYEWMKDHAAELLERTEAVTEQESKDPTVVELLSQEIERLQQADESNVQRITFLSEELRALQPPEDKAEADVLLLQIPQSLIRRKILKPAMAREIAGIAILNGLKDAEALRAVDLRKQLQEQGLENLIRTIPGQADAEPQKQLRQLLVKADRMTGRTSRLVYFNGTWLSEAAAAADQQAMMLQMMTGGLQSQLQELLNETAGPLPGSKSRDKSLPEVLPASAVSLVRKEAADVVEVKTMQLDAASGTATVGMAIYWQEKEGEPWKIIEKVTASANQSDVSEESRQRILQDERVKQVTELFAGLGAGGGQLNSALTMGAVVESASGKAEAMLRERLNGNQSTATAKLNVSSRRLSDPESKPKQE